MILPYRFTLREVWHEVSCKGCGAGAGSCPTVADACVRWNTRKGSNDLGDVAKALPISAVVFGMMHKIPTERLAAEIERRGGL
jgi:hypothetical protein